MSGGFRASVYFRALCLVVPFPRALLMLSNGMASVACGVSSWSHEMENPPAATPGSENTPCVNFSHLLEKQASVFVPQFRLALLYFGGGRLRGYKGVVCCRDWNSLLRTMRLKACFGSGLDIGEVV